MKLLKVLALVSVAVVLGGIVYTAEPAGYCATQNRYIPDKEFIDASKLLYDSFLSHEYQLADGSVKKNGSYDIEAYKYWNKTKDKPKCCDISRTMTESMFNRVFRLQKVFVTLYTGKSRGDSQVNFRFDVCGKLEPEEPYYFDPRTFDGLSTSEIINYPSILQTSPKSVDPR